MKGGFASHQSEFLEIRQTAAPETPGTSLAKQVVRGDPNFVLRTKTMSDTTPGPHDRLLAQLAAIPACQRTNDGADWFPPVDIVEDDEEYLFKVDLPEVKPEDLQVTLEDGALVISGDRANPWQGEKKVLRVERPHGFFVRRFALPDDAKAGDVSSYFADSVLEVRVRKVSAPVQLPAPTNATPRLRLRLAS